MFRRLLFLFLALLLVFGVTMAWYVSSKGFTRKWRTFIVAEFRKAGVEVHIRRLTLDPFRGLVAKEVTVLDARDKKSALAWVDEVLLGVNYAAAIRGQTFLDSADLRDANLWLPLDPKDPEGPRISITKLNARLYLPPRQIYLAKAQAEVHGIQVFASGRLINPQAWDPKAHKQAAVMEIGQEVLQELEKVHFGNPAPTLTIEFSGDLAHPDQIQADLRFRAREVRRKAYEFKSINVVASCRQGVIELQQLHAVDARGELRASGTYDLDSKAVAVHAKSTLHLGEIDKAFRWFPDLDDWTLNEPPGVELNLSGALEPAGALKATGHVEMHHSAFRRIPFKELASSFSWEAKGWSLRDFHLAHDAGELTGDATFRPGDFRAQLNSTLDPGLLVGLLKPNHAEWLARFDFTVPPTLQLDVRGTAPALEACEGNGKLTYSRVRYQGLPATPTSSTLHFAKELLTLEPFTLEQDAKAGPSKLLFDFARHEVRLEKPAPPPE
ncbi:MAG TPA: hypothetical protein VGO11_20355 [Chthoniobacteraceae bacterium]|jgi:hypothetical protein|nr:hypothetical protein [Chthoniobacteraceae bacterium]